MNDNIGLWGWVAAICCIVAVIIIGAIAGPDPGPIQGVDYWHNRF